MSEFYRPQSDDMTGFDSTKEKVVECLAADENGNEYTIQVRVLLSPEELNEIKIAKIKAKIAEYEVKLADDTITEFEFNKLNLLYKLI